ncbi:putative zinc ribbon protein [Citrobacter amalonaticus]|uniref:DUF7828 domain-containing protein n=1 Tax=Citrobacter amalonaticus TaxID=35703 RepID=UPI0012D43D15|nr:putative zinc ribbon protein [Citrobacter amalonaticus]
MRMLKCYMASDSSGHLVTAGEAIRAPELAWSCTSCCQRRIKSDPLTSPPTV